MRSTLMLAGLLAIIPLAGPPAPAAAQIDGRPPLSRHGGSTADLFLLAWSAGRDGFYASAGLPLAARIEVELIRQGEGAGLHVALLTLPAALYLDVDGNGLGIQLDTLLATGFHIRSGIPGRSHAGADLWILGSGVHLGGDSAYAWSYWGGAGFRFSDGSGFALSQSPVRKARIFGAYGGPGYQGFGMIGAPATSAAHGEASIAQSLSLGAPGFSERPRDAVDAAYRLHDIQFNGAGGPYSWAWGGENDRALVEELRRSAPLWWHNPFALAKAALTMAVWR